jgi:hypothetical protein
VQGRARRSPLSRIERPRSANGYLPPSGELGRRGRSQRPIRPFWAVVPKLPTSHTKRRRLERDSHQCLVTRWLINELRSPAKPLFAAGARRVSCRGKPESAHLQSGTTAWLQLSQFQMEKLVRRIKWSAMNPQVSEVAFAAEFWKRQCPCRFHFSAGNSVSELEKNGNFQDQMERC